MKHKRNIRKSLQQISAMVLIFLICFATIAPGRIQADAMVEFEVALSGYSHGTICIKTNGQSVEPRTSEITDGIQNMVYQLDADTEYRIEVTPDYEYNVEGISEDFFEEEIETGETCYVWNATGAQLGEQRLQINITSPSIIAQITGGDENCIQVQELDTYATCIGIADGERIRYETEAGKRYRIMVDWKEGHTATVTTERGNTFIYQEDIGKYVCETNGANENITVAYEKNLYNVSVSIQGGYGRIDWGESGENADFLERTEQNKEEVTVNITVPYGDTPEFTITPRAGYYVKKVTVGEEELELSALTPVAQSDAYTYQLPAIEAASSICVTYAIRNKQKIAVSELGEHGIEIELPQDNTGSVYIVSPGEVTIQGETGRSVCLNEEKTGEHYKYEQTYVINESIFIQTLILDHGDTLLELKTPIYIRVDNDTPKITVEKGTYWITDSTKEFTIRGTASDMSGIKKVVWSTSPIANPLTHDNRADYDKKSGTYTIQLLEEDSGFPTTETTYYIYAVDESDQIKSITTTVKFDSVAPKVESINIAEEDYIIYEGQCYVSKSEIGVELVAGDLTPENATEQASGIEKVVFIVVNEQAGQTKVEQDFGGSYSVPLEPGENCIGAYVVDYAGNVSEGLVWNNGQTLYYDVVVPEVTIQGLYEADDIYYMGKDASFTVAASQKTTGIASIQVEVLDENQNVIYTQLKEHAESLTVSLGNTIINNYSKMYLRVYVYANSGSKKELVEKIQIDRDNPSISDITIQSGGEEDALSIDDSNTYGYFGTEQVVASIQMEEKEQGSGIKTIRYYFEDVSGEMEPDETIQIDGHCMEKEIAVPLAPDCKGYLFVEIEDNVGNKREKAYQTQGIILESKKKHEASSDIQIIPKQEAEGDAIYNEDVELAVTIEDTYSGIGEIEWSVAIPGEETQTVSYDMTKDSIPQEWGITTTGEENLITKADFVIPVEIEENTEKSGIEVTVCFTDRAGHSSEDTYLFSIDKKAPEVTISFTGAGADPQYTDIYHGGRTARIEVQDAFFEKQSVVWNLETMYGSTVEISSWESEGDIHRATIQFQSDDTYVFSMECKDLAGHDGNIEEQIFTIDQTKPVIEIRMDGSAVNGNYYNQKRTAVIHVTERNFIAERIRVEGTGMQENTSALPTLSEWRTVADGYEATLSFTEDGTYAFSVSGRDKAGNAAETKTVETFIIDTTFPEIVIEGVEDRSSNNKEVAPIIHIMDNNMNLNATEIRLTGVNRGEVKTEGTQAVTETKKTVTFEDFAYEPEVDDIYTLLVTQEDLAGNQTTQSITFSVNRFGSVYTFAEELQQLVGNYVKEPVDVIFTETNIDALDMESIRIVMTRNGVPKDLIAEEDYDISVEGGNGSWSQYTYTLGKELFAADGVYTVTIYSEDQAGNRNQNIQESKRAEIAFGVDATLPLIAAGNLESKKTYKDAGYEARVSVTDNLQLSEIYVELNGEEIAYEQDGDDILFLIPESKERQDVKIVATDAAGNEETLEIERIVVSTNLFVRIMGNPPLLFGSIGLLVAFVGFGTFLGVRIYRRKQRA